MIALTLLALAPLALPQASVRPATAPAFGPVGGAAQVTTSSRTRTRAQAPAAPLARSGASLPLIAPPTAVVKAGPQGAAVPSPIPDCNRNGIPDPAELAAGLAPDCQGDGVIDDCQLATAARYLWDDEQMNAAYTFNQPHLAWLAAHQVKEGGYEVVTEIEVAWGLMASGSPAKVALWSDPNGDGNPADAELLMEHPVLTDFEFTGVAVRYDVPDTFVGTSGTGFFVGVYGSFNPAEYPAGFDTSVPSLKSFVVASSTPIQPDDLLAGGVVTSGVMGDGDFVVRAISCPGGVCGQSVDGDFSGVPDECEPQDCNGNGVPDLNDVLTGTSQDCNFDTIPDECQTDTGVVYTDAEVFSGAVGTAWEYYAWLTQITVQPGGELITDIDIAYGGTEASTPVLVGLWDDPNGDGDPADSNLIVSVQTFSQKEFSGEYFRINIPDTFVGPAGTSFFVGAYGQFPLGTFAANIDVTSSDQRSFFISADVPLDLDDLSANTLEYGLISANCSCDGDWLIKAISCTTGHCGEADDINGNAVPDECDPDCDGDGVPDDYEILTGSATDCDGSGVPDACETLADCDANGLPDLCQATTPTGLAAEYYATPSLTGAPLSRIDQGVFFDFDQTPPFPGLIPQDGFSVRWTGSIRSTTAGTYTFGVAHDDGARLWVNGRLLIDAWQSSTGQLDTATIDLAAATDYYLVLEYYEAAGAALCELYWETPGGTLSPVQASDTRPIYDRNVDGVPDGCQVADCNGNGVDDGEDVLFGTSLDLDGDGTPDECEPCEDCDGNRIPDAVEPLIGPGLVGQYFLTEGNQRDLADFQGVTIDPVVDFDWGTSSPALVPTDDDFGARWTGSVTTPAGATGSYTFHLLADDGVRLWIDGALVIDEWQPSAGNEYSAIVNLVGGTSHLVRIEYYEAGGGAKVRFSWTVPGAAKVVVPASALSPSTDLDGDGVPDTCTADCDLDGVIDALEADLDGDCVPDDCQGGVGYWRFEETTGAQLTPDSSGSGLDGSISPFSTRVVDVPVATVPGTGAANTQSLDLGFKGFGTGGYVFVQDAGGLLSTPNSGFTLEAWVKLVSLSGSSNPEERQWLFQKKPSNAGDSQLEYGLLVQAGNLTSLGSGPSGRELLFRYGDGASDRSVSSELIINDQEWHHVSVAYDPARRQLRFGLDGQFDTHYLELPFVPGGGPLYVGAHTNAAGLLNQYLRGQVDEVRFTRYYLPEESLLNR